MAVGGPLWSRALDPHLICIVKKMWTVNSAVHDKHIGRFLASAKNLILICVEENGGGKLWHERSDRFSRRVIFWSVAIQAWVWIKPHALVLFQSSRKPTWFTSVFVFGPITECSPYNCYARSGKMWFMLTIWLHWETSGFTHFCSWINHIF